MPGSLSRVLPDIFKNLNPNLLLSSCFLYISSCDRILILLFIIMAFSWYKFWFSLHWLRRTPWLPIPLSFMHYMYCLLIFQLILCSYHFFFFFLDANLFSISECSFFPVFADSISCSGVCPVVLLCSTFAEHKYAQNSRDLQLKHIVKYYIFPLGHPRILKSVATFGYATYFSSFN